MQISKRVLPNEIYTKFYSLLFNLLGKRKTKQEFFDVISNIFSYKEQIMIIKRIAILYMLTKNISVIEISKILKVSKSTGSKYLKFYEENKELVVQLKKISKRNKIFTLFDDIYHTLLSPPTKYGTDWETGWKIEIERMKRKRLKI